MMCDHGDEKQATFIDNIETAEVYMCECGALIDLAADKNFQGPFHPMTPEELMSALSTQKDMWLDELRNAVEKLLK